MNIPTNPTGRSLDHETVGSITKLTLVAVWLVVVASLLTLVPGADRFLPGTVPAVDALLGAIATIVLVGFLLYVAPTFASIIRARAEGPTVLIADIASAVYWLVVLTAVLVAYRGFEGVVSPVFDGMVWIYDLAFLLLALPLVVLIGVRLYASLDPIAARVAEKLHGGDQVAGRTQQERYDTS